MRLVVRREMMADLAAIAHGVGVFHVVLRAALVVVLRAQARHAQALDQESSLLLSFVGHGVFSLLLVFVQIGRAHV